MSKPRKSTSIRLNLEELEQRDVFSVSVASLVTFDQAAAPLLPAGWTQWSSTGSNTFVTSSAEAYSGANSLATNAVSSVTARIWENTAVPAGDGVQANVLANSLIPVEIFARGQNLSTTTPTFYAVGITRGLQIDLVRVVNGVSTTLASLASAAYLSSTWINVSLTFNGNQLSVQVMRDDTSQYLNSAGTWGSTAVAALQATDAVISGSGQVGINRPALYAGTAYVDDFAVLAPSTAAVAGPSIPQHLPNIRIAELAYSGTPEDSTETQLLQNDVDLVVPDPEYLGAINQIAPNTPQLIYSNVSNLYGSLLTDWLNWANANGVPEEDAFYHVSVPTPFTGMSASSQPVDWFWNVELGPNSGTTGFTNLTSAAHTATVGGVAFGSAGQSLYIGYTEMYNEINFVLSQHKLSGFSYIIEYPTAVNSSGNPTAWGTLALDGDTTDSLSQSGQITFDPPAGWVSAVVPGSMARLYYVRIRTITGTAAEAPIATTILGDDYVNANGTDSGIIPVYDYAADVNHTGYLTAAEYAVAESIGDYARFAYQSRLFFPSDGQMRFVLNPSSTAVRSWAIDENIELLKANPLADGIFLDNSSGKSPTTGYSVVESTASYSADFGMMLGEINSAIAPKWLMANIANSGTRTTDVVSQIPATLDESAIRALTATWADFVNLADDVSLWQQTNPPGYLVLDSMSTGGSETDPRTQLATLAYYYLIGNPTTTFLMPFGGESPSSSWSQHWFNAIAYNVGTPTGGYTLFATGQDPSNTALTYNVYARQYSNALVLYKPLSYTLGKGTGTIAANTATVEQLGGTYRPLNADGTLGAPITSISLMNGQGAILIKD